MKFVVILSLFFGVLFAKSSDACYSVQLKSFYLKKNSSYNFERKNYPSSCILVNIGGLRSVRCGCFEHYSDAEDKLDRLQNEYYDAIIVNTYKRRFSKVSRGSSDDSYSSNRNEPRRDDFSNNSRYDEYPSEVKEKRDEVKQTSRSYQRENSYNQESTISENEDSLYEEEDKNRKRSFYGQDDEDEDLYQDDEPEVKGNTFYGDEKSSQNHYRRANRDYSRDNANKW